MREQVSITSAPHLFPVRGRRFFIIRGKKIVQALILCRSLTSAQRAALTLERKGITAAVLKAPQHLRGNGCGYALGLSRRLGDAVRLLRQQELLTGRIYVQDAGGQYTEVYADDLS